MILKTATDVQPVEKSAGFYFSKEDLRMESTLYAVSYNYIMDGSVREKVYYFDTYDSALAYVNLVKENPQNQYMRVLYLTIHKTYFDDMGILQPVYESVYLWENHNDN